MESPADRSRNIFLVGPMGVGKTTIGRLLSQELGLEFFDSDQEIEKRAGADIAWIFDVEGEEGFRIRESSVLDDLTLRSGVLIATGGGSILEESNRRMLRSRGTVVFLDTSLEIQLRRTERDKKRPLLQNVDHEKVLAELKAARDPLYNEVADVRVFAGDSGSRKTVSIILEQLKDHGYIRG
ncbi:MAG: shikimate kinase AroK [Pseudomonadales bacterium]|nr:shikimate kinase AroK [Pseudomonadales bacterium]